MVTAPFCEGVRADAFSTSRLTTRLLSYGPGDGQPVLLLHGNLCSATWWETTLVALPAGWRGLAPDLRGFGDADRDCLIDATCGMADLAEDAIGLLDLLEIETFTVVGNSLGGSAVWKLVADHPHRVASAVLIAPGPPHGFGGVSGADGRPIHPDFSGSGAGLIAPDLVRALQNEDRGDADAHSPRRVFRDLIVGRPTPLDHEDRYVEAMLSVHLGQDRYPGDIEGSPNWPYVAPGRFGPANALSPKYTNDAAAILDHDVRPPITWIRGDRDLIVADGGPLDPGVWGTTGLVPGYQGAKAYPPQSMIAETRALLDAYAASGGRYEEVVIADAGHVPFLDQPDDFNQAFHKHLANA